MLEILVVGVMVTAGGPSAAAAQLTSDVTPDPGEARFVYEDIHNFVRAHELLCSKEDTIGTLQTEYFDRATPGLLMFVEKYDLTPERLRDAIRKHADAYALLGDFPKLLESQEPAFRNAYADLQRFLPDTRFPPTYFLVGAYRGIGSGSTEGPLISVEKETAASVERDLVTTLVHEMIHLQQLAAQGEQYFAIFGPKKTLLALSIREGTADYFAVRVTGVVGEHSQERRAYVFEHEKELWEKFQMDMYGEETGDWMWSTPSDPDQPPHVGYSLGARIVQAYYEGAEDKSRAAREIMSVKDYAAFLEKSGYAEHLAER
jgi:hypothetical protein